MQEIAPGAILQRMYLKHRLKKLNHLSAFCEVGSGNGHVSRLLLKLGLRGTGIDLNESACRNNRILNKKKIESNQYKVIQGNFFDTAFNEKFDIIISSMVIEHFEPELVSEFFKKSMQLLSQHGTIITIVPSGMKHWGVEDDVAGHVKRYDFEDFEKISREHKLSVRHIAGLTYPLSNILLKISNYIVGKNEKDKENLTMEHRTVLSGNRNVKYKTHFPAFFKIFLNDFALLPFYILQCLFKGNRNSLVIYCELGKTEGYILKTG